MSRNKTLDRAGRTQLILWLSKNEEILRKNSDSDTAKIAGKELGLHITSSHVRGQRQVQYPNMEGRKHPGSPVINMVAALERRLAALENSLGVTPAV